MDALAAGSHVCVHWSAVGPFDAKDPAICSYARDHNFILVTNDLDFPRMLAHTKAGKPSVILLRGEPLTPETRAEALLGAIAECSKELDAGAVLTVDWTDRPRAHLLPL